MGSVQNDLREALMIEQGREKKRLADAEALRTGREAEVGPYRVLVSKALTTSYAEIDTLVQHKGRMSSDVARVALRETGLDGKTIGAVTLQSLIAGASNERTLQTVLLAVGSHVEDEVRLRWLLKQEPGLYRYLDKESAKKGTTDYGHRRNVFMSAMTQLDNIVEEWVRWDLKTKVRVGMLLTDVYVRGGIFEKVTRTVKARSTDFLLLTPQALAELAAMTERMAEFVRPEFRPMVDPPTDWISPTEGGYNRLDVPLMKKQSGADIKRLAGTDMPLVYKAINAIQSTPWAINEDVLVVVEELQRLGTQIEGLPVVSEATAPVRSDEIPPPGEELNEEQTALLRKYQMEKRAWHDAEGRRKSQAMQAIQAIQVAKENRNVDAIYFPHHLDFRGRIYPIPSSLNPQANDLGKGLLTFATKRPLGTWGSYWLAIHGANTNGVKGTLNERVEWTLENSDRICAVAENPLDDLWWTEADGGSAPWQMLAFCYEWAGYIESGESEEFMSSLPVAVDGTCNGLQHYSALLRDQGGAEATNLTNSEGQADIYTAVAERAIRITKERMAASAEARELGGLWMAYGITRSTVKRAVMTTPYGVTVIGTKNMILDDGILGKGANRDFNWNGKQNEAAAFLAGVVDAAIGEEVSSAKGGMAFIKAMGKVANSHKKGISWVTPAGLPVVQTVRKTSKTTIATRLLGRVKLNYGYELEAIDSRKQISSISPNFIHSLDAAHLMLTVCALEDSHGPASWAMIHDSYATHAGLTDELGQTLRRSFVDMYKNHCPLEALRDSVMEAGDEDETTLVPEKGDFDLEEVMKAEFFFA